MLVAWGNSSSSRICSSKSSSIFADHMHSTTDLHSTTTITPFPVTMETKEGMDTTMTTMTITIVMVMIMMAATITHIVVVDPGRSLEDMATKFVDGQLMKIEQCIFYINSISNEIIFIIK